MPPGPLPRLFLGWVSDKAWDHTRLPPGALLRPPSVGFPRKDGNLQPTLKLPTPEIEISEPACVLLSLSWLCKNSRNGAELQYHALARIGSRSLFRCPGHQLVGIATTMTGRSSSPVDSRVWPPPGARTILPARRAATFSVRFVGPPFVFRPGAGACGKFLSAPGFRPLFGIQNNFRFAHGTIGAQDTIGWRGLSAIGLCDSEKDRFGAA